MSERKLLREWIALECTPKMIQESREKNNGKLVLNGIFQRAAAKNQNKRVYPRGILEREIENYQKAVRERRALGQIDHPDSSTVALEKAALLVTELFWDGNDVRGKLEILSTPSGKILENLLNDGVLFGISSRGVGSTNSLGEGCDEVQEDFQLICFDAVSEPSTHGAYLFSENKIITADTRLTKADRINRALNQIVRK